MQPVSNRIFIAPLLIVIGSCSVYSAVCCSYCGDIILFSLLQMNTLMTLRKAEEVMRCLDFAMVSSDTWDFSKRRELIWKGVHLGPGNIQLDF